MGRHRILGASKRIVRNLIGIIIKALDSLLVVFYVEMSIRLGVVVVH